MIELPHNPTFSLNFRDSDHTFPLNSDVHMLERGISTYVFPSYRDEGDLNFKFVGNETDIEVAKAILNSLDRNGFNHSEKDIVSDAGNVIAREICSDDALSMFELCLSDRGPVLVSISPRRVGHFHGVLYSRRKYSESSWKRTIATGNRFWIMEFPTALGGATGHRRLLRSLNKIGPILPRFRMMGDDYHFDRSMSGYRHDYVSFLTSATRRLGWYAGGSYFEYCTEYYMLHRALQAKRAKLILRNYIVDGMNSFFRRTLLDCTIEVSGGTTLRDCDLYEERFRKGEIPTSEMSKWIHHDQ